MSCTAVFRNLAILQESVGNAGFSVRKSRLVLGAWMIIQSLSTKKTSTYIDQKFQYICIKIPVTNYWSFAILKSWQFLCKAQ